MCITRTWKSLETRVKEDSILSIIGTRSDNEIFTLDRQIYSANDAKILLDTLDSLRNSNINRNRLFYNTTTNIG